MLTNRFWETEGYMIKFFFAYSVSFWQRKDQQKIKCQNLLRGFWKLKLIRKMCELLCAEKPGSPVCLYVRSDS